MTVPKHPKIYHIVHVDRLPSIIANGLWCDSEMLKHPEAGTMIGMMSIKKRRLRNSLDSHFGLHVGDCVPFYFCPRSVMLYVLYQRNYPELVYRGGQGPIVHMEFDLYNAVDWAEANDRRWAFTLSNAGASNFEDRASLANLHEIDWEAVASDQWSGHTLPHSGSHGKQAEFLIEGNFPWNLVERIGVQNKAAYTQVAQALVNSVHKPRLEVIFKWYY